MVKVPFTIPYPSGVYTTLMVQEEFARTDGTQLFVSENEPLVSILVTARRTGSLFMRVMTHGGLGMPIPCEIR